MSNLKIHGIGSRKNPRNHRVRFVTEPKTKKQADRILEGHLKACEAIHANPGNYYYAAQILSDYFIRDTAKVKLDPNDHLRAYAIVERFLNQNLWQGKYERAAQMLWPSSQFTCEPYSVREIWKHLKQEQQPFIIGPSAVGKSRSIAAWLLLDWANDPYWTYIKLLSVTKEHAEKNIFAHVKNLHRSAAFPLPGEVLANSIRVGERLNSGFQLSTVPQGDSGAGRLRGCHPDPRLVPDAQFGTHSRIRIALDEAELVGDGAYADIGNLLSTEGSDTDHMKIIAATNPADQNTPFGRACEPVHGWKMLDPETATKWTGQNGVSVLRIDGAKTENVAQKKLIFPGFMTYEGFMRYMARGATDSEAWTMGRGYWPPGGSVGGLILPADQFDAAEVTADYIFTGSPINLGAIDTALEGGDDCVATHGRFGYVWGLKTSTGRTIKFPQTIPCLQALTGTVMPKGDAVKMGSSIKDWAMHLGIDPEHLIIDSTGNGSGVHAWLKHYWRPGEVMHVVGIDSGSAASDLKIYSEDDDIASNKFKGMHTELAFAAALWLQYGYLKLSKGYPVQDVRKEITNRRYITQGKLRIVEKKETYKARMKSSSPDRMDSLALLVHRARMIDVGTLKISMIKPQDQKVKRKDWFDTHGPEEQHQDSGVEMVDLNG